MNLIELRKWVDNDLKLEGYEHKQILDKIDLVISNTDHQFKCLRDLRYGIFKDADAVNGLIDKTISDYETSLVEHTDKTI
ncbi:MAG: hypothetical protein IPJ81_06990 [Chitinophagaceae bacterium]|nr:hypothetical protein [Chitinophagaceae bacterium]